MCVCGVWVGVGVDKNASGINNYFDETLKMKTRSLLVIGPNNAVIVCSEACL